VGRDRHPAGRQVAGKRQIALVRLASPRMRAVLMAGGCHTVDPLPSMEVLDRVKSLCSSHDLRAAEMLGTGLGDRLRDDRAMFVRSRGNKNAICWPFLKPSDGLEPS